MRRTDLGSWLLALMLFGACGVVSGIERFPPPNFESDYTPPTLSKYAPPSRAAWLAGLDIVVLLAALVAATWIIHRLRSRKAMCALSIFSLAYFGFFRGGCVCPIGAIQNVSLALADPRFSLSFGVAVFFTLPLVFALLFGRVFCGAVCPLGAIQDLVLFRPVRIPGWLCRGLNVLPYFYLGLAVFMAATGSAFIICLYDPFVGFFRLAGPARMLLLGLGFLILGAFVGRPYCRFVCPYGALLGVLSRVAGHQVSTTPDECVVCGLCAEACPFDAIEPANAEGGLDE